MKKEFEKEQSFDQFGFEVISSNEMNSINGGSDFYVKFDPETGKFYIVVKPKRP